MKFQKKKIILILSIFVLLALTASYVMSKKGLHPSQFRLVNDELLSRENERVAGIYYQANHGALDTSNNYAHLVLVLNNHSAFNIDMSILNKVPKNMNLLLTMEFWGNKFVQRYDGSPLKEIIDGSLDAKLDNIFNKLLDGRENISIRINPEMELWTYQFPWHNSDYYIEAYRYIVTKWKTQNPELKFVWGPSGFMGAERFYPGDDVVDFVSITLQSNAEKRHTRYPSYKSPDQELHRKLHRMRFIEKPVMVIASANSYSNDQISASASYSHNLLEKYESMAYNNALWDSQQLITRDGKPILGVYDPRELLVKDPAIDVEHIFVDFGQIQSGSVLSLIDDVYSRGHDAVLTVEPWKDLKSKTDTSVLKNIVKGKYDTTIQALFNYISNRKQTIYLRFAHEMEIPISRYAWQSKSPLDYIESYRYFMQFAEPFPKNVKRIWGPAGDRGSPDFYPGDDVVDYVSFAVYGLPDKNITDYKKQRTFSSIYNDKKKNFRFINKPFFITEFGVKGPKDYKSWWLSDAASTLRKNPQVIGACYFNMSDTPGAWGEIEEPDWSIGPANLQQFLKTLTD